MRISGLAKNLSVSLLALSLALVSFEIYLRLFSPQIMEHDRMFERDPELGWRFKKNKQGGIVYSAATAHWIRTNEDGFRDNSFGLDKRPRKIFALGDSFTSNINVRGPEVFTEILEGLLPETSVMNLGVNGYGQAQEYLLFKKMLLKFKPALAIVTIYVGNDFEDNLQLVPQGFLQEPEAFRLTNFSQSAAWLETQIETLKAARSLDRWRRQSWDPPAADLYEKDSPSAEKKFKTTEDLLLKIDALGKENGVPVLFVLAPFIAQAEPSYDWNDFARRSDKDPADFDPFLPQKKISSFAEKNGLDLFDLTPLLRSEAAAGRKAYDESELHWTADGNRAVAQALARRIQESSLLRDHGPSGS